MRSRSHRKRGGYVLLVVMAASVLVVTVLGTLAKTSLRRAIDATDAHRSLQQRWGALTLQRALLERAAKIFELREKFLAETAPNDPPPPFIREAITIGDVTFDVMLGDEDAKLNLNALYHQVGNSGTERAIGAIVGPDVAQVARLLPTAPPQSRSREQTKMSLSSEDEDEAEEEEEKSRVDVFGSWGQIFDIARLNAVVGSDLALPNVTTGITCWGSGQLNFRRASDEAILASFRSVVQDGGARRILQRYRQSPTATLQVLMHLEISRDEHRERLSRLVTESSNNFSIWISATSKTGRGLTEFTVARRDDEGITRFSKFAH